MAATTGPVFAESKNPGTDRRAYIRFLSRLFTHPGPETVSIIFGGLKNLRERVFELLCQSIPHVPRKEMAWRYLFLSGSVHFTAGQIGYVEVISDGKCDSSNLPEALAHLIASQSAMLSAPATTVLHKKLARQYGQPAPAVISLSSKPQFSAAKASQKASQKTPQRIAPTKRQKAKA